MRIKKIASCALAAMLSIASLVSCSGDVANYEKYELIPNEGFGDKVVESADGGFEIVSLDQLTESDIQKMNDGKARFVYENEGYLSFLNGKFSDKKIENYEDAVASIQSVAGLLGLGAGSEFFATHVTADAKGYTYYTFQQKYGDLTIMFATLKIIVGPDGYTAGLASSFVPNVGIPEKVEEVSQEEAEAIVVKNMKELCDYDVEIISEYTFKAAVTCMGKTRAVYTIYSENPNFAKGGLDKGFGLKYNQYFVTLDGKFITDMWSPVATVGSNNADLYRNEDYFANLETKDKTYTLTKWDGSTVEVTVPLSYNPGDGYYYLMDPSRKIAVGDYDTLNDDNDTALYRVEEEDGKFPDYFIFAYANVIKAYDFYADLGLYSVDGTGVPIMVCVGMEEDNACYFGVNNGWGSIAFSPNNTYSQALDVIGHEYTHGIMRESMVSIYNIGESGAVSEAYADMVGNVIEMSTGSTDDTEWLMGENAGNAIRSMSDPSKYNQPTSIYDKNYADPENLNYDGGGVHQNNSIVSPSAYKLYQEGMSYHDLALLYVKSIQLLHPCAQFVEVYESLIMSVEINGFDEKYKDVITEHFRSAGVIE